MSAAESLAPDGAPDGAAAEAARPATAARPAWRIDWTPVPRVHVALLALLSILLTVYLVGNIHLHPESSDSRTNFEVGVTFGETGTFGPDEKSVGWHMREPLAPFLAGVYHVVRSGLGLATAPLDCRSHEEQQTAGCMVATAPYRHINVAFIVLAAVSAFLLVHGTVGSAIPAYAAFAATGNSAMLLNGLQRFLTEGMAAALMALSAVLVCALLARRRAWHAVALGLCLAGLTLTKVIFAYLWVVIAAGLLVLAFTERRKTARLAVLAGVMAVAYLAITGAWMTRNYLTADQFRLMDGRSYRVLSVRASYNEMRMDEWLAGFVYFLPLFTERDMEAMGYPRASFERFNSANVDGFRQVGQERYRVMRREETKKAIEAGVPQPVDRHVFDLMAREFRARMLSDPVAHLRVSVLLAYLSTFPEWGLGNITEPKIGRLADDWPIPVPAGGYQFSRTQVTWINAATTIAILAIPFVLYLRNRNIGGLVIALPVLYSHGVYAIASHFNVRYARPEIPLRNVALCILVWLAVTALVMLVRRHAMRRIEGAATAEAP